tara:strand:+ start:6143 stop:6490 length:348 start_codon:yes stop_codon:yes gene_type:complete
VSEAEEVLKSGKTDYLLYPTKLDELVSLYMKVYFKKDVALVVHNPYEYLETIRQIPELNVNSGMCLLDRVLIIQTATFEKAREMLNKFAEKSDCPYVEIWGKGVLLADSYDGPIE